MKIKLLSFVLAALFFNACNVGVNKDLLSGLKMTNNGLSYKEAFLQMDEAKLNSSEFPTGKEIFLYTKGVSGFTLKEGMIYLGGSISILDENGKEVLGNPDLFTEFDQTGIAPEQAEDIHFKLTVGEPLVVGSKYTWKSKIWDKNGKGTIDAELEFVVK